MKKIISIVIGLCLFTQTKAQVTAKDCTAAVNVCTNNSFSVSPAGAGFSDFTTSSNISNPTSNPVGVVPTGGLGCLKAGELNPTWMIINIQTPGTLEFSMGAGTGPGAQSGCYDWIMWPYNASTCSGINSNTLPPVRCCWNSMCSGGTGLASAANLPAGGSPKDYGAPINVNCGDKFIMCFSNYSSVNTLVPLNFFGTAIVSCSPLSSTLSINSASICPGGVATLSVASSPGNTYTWQPGGQTVSSITVSPAVTTNYTLFTTNACGTFSGTTSVFVSPAMNISFSNTNGTCVPATLGSSTVSVIGGSSPYSYSWSPATSSLSSISGLTSGTYSVKVTDALGCTATGTTNIIAPAPFNFSLSVTSNSVLTCTNNSVVLTPITSSTLTNVTYTWTAPSSATTTGNSYTATNVGIYTVMGNDQTVGSCADTQTFSVTQNTVTPSMTVNPATTQSISCNGACAQFTAITTSTTNLVGTWLDGTGPVVGPSGTPLLLCAAAPGTYTATFCSTINGCCASQTVGVVSNTTVPTLSVTVSTANGFTINCTNPKVIMNTNSSGTCAPVGYTWTPLASPTSSTTPATGGYTANVPGQYEVKFHDCNFCYVTTTVTIYIDTLRPSPNSITNLPSNSYTLNCYKPTLIATGVTNPLLSPGSYSWTQPGPLTIPSNTVLISLGSITSGSTVTYTVAAMGANGCVGKQKVVFAKDTYTPNYIPVTTPSIGITCANPCVAMSPSSTSTVPISFTFTSPPPTQTATTSGALMCVPGSYTMNYVNLLNGCPATSTTAVTQNVVPPAINNSALVYLPCGQTTTIISANTATTSPTYSYTWAGPPGSAMSCLGGTACATSSVNMPGTYFVTILNTTNGCRSTNSVTVVAGGINASFVADPANGFSPLTVNFNNTSQTGSTLSGSITTLWNFGNGITYTTSGTAQSYSVNGLPGASTIYQSAGSYTVLLVVTQSLGTVSCVGTASAVINVELPSKMDVPNVFTPNGDGVNDTFVLQTTNLTEISCQIFDRWGVKMYDVKSEKGNIEWDGKNLSKKDVPDGTYFYLLKAKGKDLKDFEQNGTISLYK